MSQAGFLDRRKDFADLVAEDEIRLAVIRRGVAVDEDELVAGIIIDQARRGIDRQRCAADDQHIRRADCLDRTAQRSLVESFLVEHDVRLDESAARAVRHAVGMQDVVRSQRASVLCAAFGSTSGASSFSR